MKVWIVKLDRGFSIHTWLCDPCIGWCKRDGWTEAERKTPPHSLHCDRCGTAGDQPTTKATLPYNETADERSDT